MADTDWNLHSKQLTTPTDNDRMLVEPSDETAKAVEVGGFRNWLMSTALFNTLTTTAKNIIGAIEEVKGIADLNTTQLNAKANKNNSEFTGTMKLNNSNVVTEGTSFKHYAAVANPNGGSFVDVSLPDIINNFVVAQNGNSNITKLYVIGTYFEPTTKNTRIELSGTYTGAMQFNIVYK